MTESVALRFRMKVRVGEPHECWPWQAAVTKRTGYGRFSPRAGIVDGAHRVAWELEHGKSVPPGLDVCHTCDNRVCVNPAHLWVGTRKQNCEDMVSKNRSQRVCGEKMWSAKLTSADVKWIRRNRAGLTQREMARVFGVNPGTISRAASGDNWSHL